jgi:nucleotide-binding universal stress UspA family protein
MEHGTGGTIVVGVDGSEQSVEALRWAARLAPAFDARLKVVGAWENPPEYVNFVHFKDDHFDDIARKHVDEAIRKAFDGQVPDGLSTTVEFGHPSKVLVRESEDASMLVVGRRGHGGFQGLLMGSVSSACVAHAHCPVLVIHEAPGQEAGRDDVARSDADRSTPVRSEADRDDAGTAG